MNRDSARPDERVKGTAFLSIGETCNLLVFYLAGMIELSTAKDSDRG